MNVLVVILDVVVPNLFMQRVSLGYVYRQAVFCTYARDGQSEGQAGRERKRQGSKGKVCVIQQRIVRFVMVLQSWGTSV